MRSSRPVAGYRRLSVDRNGTKIGYEVQTGPVEEWAEARGRKIVWYEDRNESAADETLHREGYEQMLQDIDAGMYSGLAVWRIDRLTRIDTEFLRVLGKVQGTGGHIFTIDEGLSTEVDSNIINIKLKVLLGDNEVRNSKRRISANKQLRKKKGLYTGGGRRPYGFEAPVHDDQGRVTNTGRVGVQHVPHEVALLREAAGRITKEKASYLDVVKDWHSRTPPVYGVTGAPWNTKTLATLLTSPRMIGMQEYEEGGEKTLIKASWEPVLDEKAWRRLVTLKAKGRAGKPYNPRGTYLLSNLVSCGGCGRPLSGSTRIYKKGGEMVGTRGYRCPSGAPYKARGHCGKLNVIADPVEKIVATHIFVRLAATRRFTASIATKADDIMTQIDEIESIIQDSRDRLAEVEAAFQAKKLKLDKMLRLQAPIEAEIENLQARAKSLAGRLEIVVPTGGEWDDLPTWFAGLTLRQQKDLVARHIRRAEVAPPGRSGRYFKVERVVVDPFDIPLSDAEVVDAQ